MSAISIVTQKLLASPDVVDIVGDKIYPIMAPQNETRPYIVLHIIDNDDTPVLAGAGKYYRTIIQCDSYCELSPAGATQVIALGDAVIDALNGVVKESVAGCIDVDVLLGSADFTESALEANTHRRYTQFAVRFRRQPGEAAGEDDGEPSGEYAFTVTAAAGDGAIGFAGTPNFAGLAAFGSISAEPIADYPLQACYRSAAPGNNSLIAFTGDVSDILAGKSVWVDGVNYGPGVQYQFSYANGITLWNRITGGPVFVAGQSYSVEIK